MVPELFPIVLALYLWGESFKDRRILLNANNIFVSCLLFIAYLVKIKWWLSCLGM